ncbi:MAG: histidine kinase [Bacteroidota bacterium]
MSKFDSASLILDLGIRIVKKNNDQLTLCLLYLNKGNTSYYKSQIDSAEYFYGEGLKIAISIKDTISMTSFYSNMAGIRLACGIADLNVIEYIMKAIALNEKKGWFSEMGDCYNNLAAAYNIQNNNQRVLYYLKKGVNAFKMAKNETKAIILIVNIADQYREMKVLDSAEYYADMAIGIGVKQHFIRGLAAAYCVKGFVRSERQDYTTGEKYLRMAFDNFTTSNDGEGILMTGNYLARTLFDQKKYKETEYIATGVLKLADSLKQYQAMKTASLTLSDLYHIMQNEGKAYQYLKIYMAASDTIEKRGNKRNMEEMTTKYETVKKDARIQLLDAENKNKEQKRKAERSYWMIGSLLFLLFSGYGVYYREKKKREAFNRKIDEVNQQVKRLQMNPHFIKNTLTFIDSLFLRKNDLPNASLYINKLQDLMELISRTGDKDKIPLKMEIEILKTYIDLLNLKNSNKIAYRIDLSEEVDEEQLLVAPALIQPIIENAFIYAFSGIENPAIELKFNLMDDILHCSVSDNGIGIEKGKSLDIQSKTKSSGLGLSLTRDRIEIMNKLNKTAGYFRIQDLSLKGAGLTGTLVELAFPVSFVY